ncbi:sulfurtransferase [Candidatus Nitrosotenuis uzonensis]|uniref:Putative 3-mercaptopyruvate sulfurtransferase n=1 Tax=Candidatus Nitrosotenuis uzonensis TaxID=1407055 RepID=A0A812EYL8_9ARCH|nr:sulfurtransferase [Candidatus Nitrosotenuis uzonensis]MCA2003781.1 sulfurtransferase [Candidatus Nitrosotenuis sp.]CAE6484464.1 putative 3-mercaptopyruvate sulfurtransferase [Candidatus Nitrosotenuis uzonensis]
MSDILVSSQWLAEHLDDDLVVVDTRPKVAYMYGHIPNSVSITVEQVISINEHGAHLVPEPDVLSGLFGASGIDMDKTVIVAGEAMDPSLARVAWTLQYLGHENLKILDLGISAWQNTGLAMTRMQPKMATTKFVPNINSQMRIRAEELKEKLGSVQILDARTPQEFFGGHLPGSVLIPFTDGIGQSNIFESKDNLKRLFEQKNVLTDREIICYCMHGHRASSLFYQLKHAGFDNVRLYDGSFIDWYSRRFPLQ